MAEGEEDISIMNKFIVEIPDLQQTMFKEFVESIGGRLICDPYEDPQTTATESQTQTPTAIAKDIRSFLSKNGISVALLAKPVVFRSQGTVSSLLNKPPETIPVAIGLGRTPWESIAELLRDSAKQEELL